jgi:transposase
LQRKADIERTCVRVLPSGVSQTMQCMDCASLEQLLGQGLSLAEIGRRFGLHEATVGYWVKKHGLQAVNQDKYGARGGLERAQLEQLVEEGASIAEIADSVGRSKATVRHWLIRYGLKTHNGRGRRSPQEVKAAKQAGHATVTMRCRYHGETEFWLEGRGYTVVSAVAQLRSLADGGRSRRSWSRRLGDAAASAATAATCAHCTFIISSHRRSGTRSTPRESLLR